MNDKTIKELVDQFSSGTLTELTLEQGDLKLSLRKETPESVAAAQASVAATAPVPAAAPVAVMEAPAAPAEAAVEAPAPTGELITAPIVGTFYRSPSPDAPAFVEEGAKVTAGDNLCILEAMKMMNQLEAEFPCRIEKVLVENGAMVEYGTPLFEVTRL